MFLVFSAMHSPSFFFLDYLQEHAAISGYVSGQTEAVVRKRLVFPKRTDAKRTTMLHGIVVARRDDFSITEIRCVTEGALCGIAVSCFWSKDVAKVKIGPAGMLACRHPVVLRKNDVRFYVFLEPLAIEDPSCVSRAKYIRSVQEETPAAIRTTELMRDAMVVHVAADIRSCQHELDVSCREFDEHQACQQVMIVD